MSIGTRNPRRSSGRSTSTPETASTTLGPVGTGGGQPWSLVTVREMVVKLTDRNFLIGTGLTLVLLLGAMGFNAFMASRESTSKVAVVDQAAAAVVTAAGAQVAAAQEPHSVTAATYPDDAAARAALTSGDAQAYLHRTANGWTLTSDTRTDTKLSLYLSEVVRRTALQENLAAAGTSWDTVSRGTDLRTDLLKGADGQEQSHAEGVRMITGFVFAMLFYMAALMFGMGIAQSVVEEKQSRVVEILATAIPIRQLLIGKVVGNTILAVGQMILYVGVALIGLSFTQYRSYLGMISGPTGWFLVFFLVGFLSLACVWAVAGSLASRSEDLQSTTTPMTILLVVVLFAGISATGTWLVISSYLPVFSTVTMPMRLMNGTASWWEAAIALAITMVFAFGTVMLGERLYRRSVMRTGGRSTLREVLRTAD